MRGKALLMSKSVDPICTPAPDGPPDLRANAPVPLPLHLAQAVFQPGLQLDEQMDMLDAMLRGIDRWRASPLQRDPNTSVTLWSEGSTQLRDYGNGQGKPLLVLPSLINRAYILDITAERSFLRALAANGYRPLLLDWGVPGNTEKVLSLADYADTRLRPALAITRVLGGGPVPVIGYCMGGALAVAAAARRPDDIRALVTLGTPWNCAISSPVTRMLQDSARPQLPTMRALFRSAAQTFGVVPSDIMQALFAMLDPGLARRKFARFSQMDKTSPEAALFIAVEDWLNDPVPVAPRVAEEVLVDWHVSNTLHNGQWSLLGGAVQPEHITCPTLSFCATNDLIAPPDNAEALPRAIPHARILRPETGHVGMIVGSKVAQSTLAPLHKFLQEV
ncbi:polyhydroxyalkanoate synthase [Monaibacterium marinum]|uniref:Polyhydroxyalkanoate synthase n=2 Tax=Pontivivens marinum TaxID=1690039 RepID=A0A2C9CR84_9RHOB|nr:polyhydroxyalkanoate synthase [Monaibacterium marinum]